MRALHVLDVLDPNKAIPRLAFKMAQAFQGSSSFASNYSNDVQISHYDRIIHHQDWEILSIKEALAHQDDFDVIHLHTAVYSISFRKAMDRCIHHFYGSSGFRFNQYAVRHEINERLMAKRFGLVISISEYLNHVYKSQYHRDSEVLYPAVDMPNIKLPFLPGFRYLFVGVLKARKRVDLLLAAMRDLVDRNQEATLTIVGSGPELSNLQNQVTNLGLHHNVSLVGKVSDENLVSLYHNCDVYVSASEWEGFGVPLLEAMSFGKPLVVSRCEAHKEIIQKSHSGLSVQTNPRDLSAAMEQALGNKEFSDNGLAFARAHSWDNFMETLMRLIVTRLGKNNK